MDCRNGQLVEYGRRSKKPRKILPKISTRRANEGLQRSIMNFTIFTPTRGRVNLLSQLLAKIQENTKDLSKVEAIFWVDSDDIQTIDFFQNNIEEYPFSIRYFIKERPESLNAAINFLASQGKGRILTNINDDCQILTKDWDEIVLKKVESYKAERGIKDDIFYIKTNDNSIDRDASKGYCSFPMISRNAVEVLVKFMESSFRGLGADHGIFRVYDSVGRVIDCPEVEYDHVYHSNLFRVMSPDIVAAEMRAKSWANPVDANTLDISQDVEKLKKYIENYK